MVDRRIKVINVNGFGPEATERLDRASPVLDVEHLVTSDPEAAVRGMADDEVEVILGSWLPADLDRVPRLRWVQVSSVGVDHLDRRLMGERGISLTNAKGLYAVPIGEFVVGAMVSVARDLHLHRDNQVRRHWSESPPIGRALRGATIAIVGYGGIGREVARLAQALGMTVVACKYDPGELGYRGYTLAGTGDVDGTIPTVITDFDGIREHLGAADYVVVTLPGAPRTLGVIDAAFLASMSPDAWLLNVGRGSTVDDDAMLAALRERRIAGAFLDVMGVSPLPPTSPYWDLSNCVITPHVSGNGRGIKDTAFAALFAANLSRYAEGGSLLNVVDLERGY